MIAGTKCSLVERERVRGDGPSYAIEYSAMRAKWPSHGKATLVMGNAITDPHFVDIIEQLAPIDAIVCWLIGVHTAVDLDIACQGNNEPALYRLRVQNGLYELADRVLRPSGVLHIVDRVRSLSDADLLEVREAHRDQAGPTALEVMEPEVIPYDRPASDHQVQLVMGAVGVETVPPAMYLVSIKARKP